MKVRVTKFNENMLGSNVKILTNADINQGDFEPRKIYQGVLLDKMDWLVGCPVFKCSKGVLGVGYDCEIVEEI